MSDAPIVRLIDVTKRFGSLIALDRIDLDIRRGEFLTLLGQSGCGKTTTLRIIAGFEEVSRGEVQIDGRPVNGVPSFRRAVNTVFQNYALFPHLNVGENVAYGLRFDGVGKRERREQAFRMLERVGLTEKFEQYPATLSGGQMQRVALARALIKNPAVLLLDEPLSALDAKLRKELQLELKRTQRETGVTFVYVTHDQEEALVMSDRIAVMDKGRICQLGTPEEVFELPANRFVAEFVGESNKLAGEIVEREKATMTIRLSSGDVLRLVPSRPNALAVGEPVRLVIRPQDFGLVPDGDEGIRATLRDVIYLGGDRKLVLELADGTPIELTDRAERLKALSGLTAGSGVRLQVASRPVHIFGSSDA